MLIHRLLISILLVTNQLLSTQAVVSPLEKVTEELKEMQETVSSVQASLIASVSLIQGRRERIKHVKDYEILIARSTGGVHRKNFKNYKHKTFQLGAPG